MSATRGPVGRGGLTDPSDISFKIIGRKNDINTQSTYIDKRSTVLRKKECEEWHNLQVLSMLQKMLRLRHNL